MKKTGKNENIKSANEQFVSEFKFKSVDEVSALAQNIFNTVREPLLALDQELRVVKASRSFYNFFKVSPDETIGTLIYNLGNQQWNIPKLRELLETILPKKTTFDNYEVAHDFSTIGKRIMLLNARQIERTNGKNKIILLAIEDVTGRKLIEAGLDKTRKELAMIKISADEISEFSENIIDTVRDPLLALDPELRVIKANRSFYDFFKVSPDETIGTLIYNLGNQQWNIPKLRELLETILPKKTTFDNYEVAHDFSTIGKRIMLLNARQIKRTNGKKKIILLAIEDITERMQLEELLTESEERYRRLFETADDGILLLDKSDGNITHANPAISEILMCNKEECIGKKLKDIGLSLTGNDIKNILLELDNSGIINYDDVSIKIKNGQTIYADIYMVDRASLVQCNIRDITERKQAEETLRTQKRIADIFLMISDEEMYAEVLKEVLQISESKHGVFGYIAENGALVVSSMTRTIWDECEVPDKNIIFPKDTWGDSIWTRAIREKKTLYSNVPAKKVPKGQVALTRNIAVPILHQNEVIGLLQVANKKTDYFEKDILILESIAKYIAPVLSARLQRDKEEKARRIAEEEITILNDTLEQRVIERTAELQAANKDLEAFSYSVSHDLRAPIRAIDGFTRRLYDEYDTVLDDEGKRLLNIVLKSTKNMGQLIDDLLAFSRLGRQEIELSQVNMEELAEEVSAELKDFNKDRKLEIMIKQLSHVKGDRALVRHVLVNLLSNAIKFTGPKDTAVIEIGNLNKDHQNTYYIKDNGVGFDMKYVHKIYDVFQRLHSIKDFEGTGVGLAIVHRIIHRHGGKIWAESEVDKGAVFYFSLPK